MDERGATARHARAVGVVDVCGERARRGRKDIFVWYPFRVTGDVRKPFSLSFAGRVDFRVVNSSER